MAEQFSNPAWQALAQCRREIAAGWEQVLAAREILRRTEWLRDRWAEQEQRTERWTIAETEIDVRTGTGMFIEVEPARPKKRQRARPAARPRRRSKAPEAHVRFGA